MLRESNKINLQTSVTSLESLYYLLKAVKDVGVVSPDDAKKKLFPRARDVVGDWSKSKKDTHTELTLEEMGLIQYEKNGDFSVSPLGDRLLNAFELQILPGSGKKKELKLVDKLQPAERNKLICGILVGVRIAKKKFGRDIHPYAVLFRLLSDPKIGGYVTKREWACFVNSSKSLRDDQYDQFVDLVLDCRKSKKKVELKKADRILTRLVAWGALVRNGKGAKMSFSLNKEFVGLAVSLTGKPLPMFMDEKAVEQKFIAWLMLQPSSRGGSISESVAKHYASMLRTAMLKPTFHSISCKNVYQIVDVWRYENLKKDILSVPGFSKFNKAAANGNGYLSKALDYYSEFLKQTPGLLLNRLASNLSREVEVSGLSYDVALLMRFLSALLAKPFVILTGLSGSGKTKLAEAFTHWLYGKDEYDKYVRQVAVGADWTNSEKLLGYPNALKSKEYVMPDTGVLQLIREASKEENKDKPFFLILDEMNLSHVERYFADFLSTMESVDGDIHLYDGEDRYEGGDETNPEKRIEHRIKFPRPNLFVIGTMNVDETTYMFSPKVLDRAQVIEFAVGADDLMRYFGGTKGLKFENLDGRGAEYAEAFLKKSHEEHPFNEAAKGVLTALFPKLKKLGAEFGFRTAGEFSDFVTIFESFGVGKPEDAIDAAIVQKLLPKLHGSQGVFSSVLAELLTYVRPVKEDADKVKLAEHAKDSDDKELYDYIYPLSADKLERMSDRLRDNGFASFAEA